MDNIAKDRKYLLWGLVGALITVVGEMLQGAAPSTDTADKMTALFSSFENLAVWRIGLGSTIGAIVHVLMSFMVYAYKISMDAMLEVTIWFVVPIVILFFVGYIPFAITMSVQFWKGNTPFPKWFWVLNPLCGKAFFGAVTALSPGSAIINGISYSNMGLSSVILFSAVLFTMGKARNK